MSKTLKNCIFQFNEIGFIETHYILTCKDERRICFAYFFAYKILTKPIKNIFLKLKSIYFYFMEGVLPCRNK